MSDATEAWEQWLDSLPDERSWSDRDIFIAGFAAGGVAALEDAANELSLAANPFKWDAADWLRARAAELSKES